MLGLLRKLGPEHPGPRQGVARVPEGTRFYVVGDIHGRADLLRRLHVLIDDDARGVPAGTKRIVVYIGDYVDRGPESRAVIDCLLEEPLADFEQVFLKGNHEDALLQFLEDPTTGPEWFSIGGDATLLGYQVGVLPGVATEERLLDIQRQLESAIPREHLDFFDRLRLSFEAGDYLFVHAGIDPERSLARQRPADLLWIREDFLMSEKMYEKIVVHGHTPHAEPEVKPNRIGIDTGAYYSNRLTCLVLEGRTRRFLHT